MFESWIFIIFFYIYCGGGFRLLVGKKKRFSMYDMCVRLFLI